MGNEIGEWEVTTYIVITIVVITAVGIRFDLPVGLSVCRGRGGRERGERWRRRAVRGGVLWRPQSFVLGRQGIALGGCGGTFGQLGRHLGSFLCLERLKLFGKPQIKLLGMRPDLVERFQQNENWITKKKKKR